MPDQADERLVLGMYAVGIVDVLSQRDQLQALSRFPETDAEIQAFHENIQNTFVAVKWFRGTFSDYIENAGAGALPQFLEQVEPDQRALFERMQVSDVRIQSFSDTVVTYTCLADPVPGPINGVRDILGACAAAMSMSFAAEQVYRGAIDVGMGGEFSKSDLYGPIISSVHHLESQVAQYPRIVIGQGLMEYLRDMIGIEGDDKISRWIRLQAENCLRMIDYDVDGVPILDYLGKEHMKQLRPGLLDTPKSGVLLDGYDFIVSEEKRFREQGNPKLTLRYHLLRSYFDRKLAPQSS